MEPITQETLLARLPRRAADSNKGSYGTVAAFAGSRRYLGARGGGAGGARRTARGGGGVWAAAPAQPPGLAAVGALRTGAGLGFLPRVPPPMLLALARGPQCCVLPCRAGADGCLLPGDVQAAARQFAPGRAVLLAGPGLGAGAGAVLQALLGGSFAWKACVLDADALNALAAGAVPPGALPENTVLTPHPGEMARLSGLTVAQVQANRPGVAARYAARHRCVLVLKGSGTVIAAPDGRLLHNGTGNPGLARGGSGDILAGMIAALLAQGLAPADAAACGVWLHGAAADRCAARKSQLAMLPHDIFDDLGALLAGMGR